jgi:S-adenosylmethionine:tRNA ribosyltransferase-isomerase
MKTSDFQFDLPPELIAQYPAERGESRLMALDRETGKRELRTAGELPEIIAEKFSAGSLPLLVFNNSRVRKARVRAVQAATGAEAEFLLISKTDDGRTWRVLAEKARRKKPGSRWRFADGSEGVIVDGSGGTQEGTLLGGSGKACGFEAQGGRTIMAAEKKTGPETAPPSLYLQFEKEIDDGWLDRWGRIPLPPYIARPDEASDAERYQTVYADRRAAAFLGAGASVAAPTAGLHFSEALLAELDARGIEKVFVTLHVGLGTFLPVRTENIEDHKMHEEVYSISGAAAEKINAAKSCGRPILAVGTTAVRTLESAWTGSGVKAGEGATSIFIAPGYRFKAIDALFTNFHTPGSTLLMLVSAFAGRELILESYACAIRERFRFFSYGDAMLII